MSHPGIDAIREMLAGSGLGEASIAEQRASMEAVAAGPAPNGTTATADALGGRPAEWLLPDGMTGSAGGVYGAAVASSAGAGAGAGALTLERAVLYLHGGGYCIGSIATHRNLGGLLAIAVGSPVVLLDYRLAPEHPFPAAVDDALAAYQDLLDRGIQADHIAVAGDSAGGGLVVALLVAARDAGLPLPAAAVCLSPWVDLSQSAPSYAALVNLDPMVTKAGLDLMAAAYLDGTDPTAPLASPLHADLSGLPPLRIEVGEDEVLLDDAVRLHERARARGVDAELVRWPDLVHVFQAFPPELVPEAAESIAGIGRYLAKHLA